MKNKMFLLCLALFISSTISSQTNIELGNENITVVPGVISEPDTNMAFVPLSVNGTLNNVKSFSFRISYDPNRITLKYDANAAKGKPGFSDNQVPYPGNLSITSMDGVIFISWINDYQNASGVTFSGKLFDLDFYYIDGFSEVEFNLSSIKNMQGQRLDYDLVNGSVTQNSDPDITVLAPDGGELIDVVGPPIDINWTSVYVDNVKIELTSDDGSTWTEIANSIDASLGTYSWTIPNINSNLCKIRIFDLSGPINADTSNSVFAISSISTIEVLSPDGGEDLQIDGVKQIKWSYQNIENVKIEYSLDNGTSWQLVVASVPANNESYTWTIPNQPTNQGLVRISDVNTPATIDVSNSVFNITSDPVDISLAHIIGAVTCPLSIPPLTCSNSPVSIPLNSGWLNSVTFIEMKIGYDEEKVKFEELVSTFPNSGVLTHNYDSGELNILWISTTPYDLNGKLFDINFSLIPENTAPVDSSFFSELRFLELNIKDSRNLPIDVLLTNGSLSDGQRGVKLFSPNGGEVLQVNNGTHDILWRSVNTNALSLYFSSNAGLNWSLISNSFDVTTGKFEWNIPNISSSNCLIKIIDSVDPSKSDSSNSVFTIVTSKSITLLSPNGGEILQNGGKKYIEWQSQNISNLLLEYSLDAGSNWTEIENSFPADSSYSWAVPDTSSDLCKIRVTDAGDANYWDISNSTFTITNQVAELRLPDLAAIPGNISIPIESDWFYSAKILRLNITFDPNVLVFSDVVSPLLSQPGNFYFTEYEGNLSITWLGESPKDLNGEIISIEFNYIGGLSDLTFTIAQILDDKYNAFNFVAVDGSVGPPPAIVSIPDLVSQSNINSLPVTISEFNSAISLDMQISYDEESLILNTLKTDKPELAQFTFQSDTGIIHISWESASTPVDLKGQLFDINFSYASTTPAATEFSELKFLKVEVINHLNQELPFNVDNGSLAPTEEPAVKLFKPDGGEVWHSNGEMKKIEWGSVNAELLTIKFSQDGGLTWDIIEDSVSVEFGQYYWLPPDIISSECKISINLVDDESIFDQSSSNFSIVSTTSVESEIIPINYFLEQNFPNPFNPSTVIRFGLPSESHVILTVYNIIGERISTLINEFKRAGVYEVRWNANNFGNGVYLYQIQSKEFNQTKKMILLK